MIEVLIIKKTALIIMVITLASKVLGFGRDVFLSYYFGATEVSDAYLISLTVPEVIFSFIIIGIVTAYIPMQSRIVEEYGVDAGNEYTSNFINTILVIAFGVFLLLFTFTEPIVKLFALGFSGDTLRMAVLFTRITLFGMFFTILVNIFSGYLQINNNYIAPALSGFPFNIIVIGSIIMASRGNYVILAFGTLLATASQIIPLIPAIKKLNFKYLFRMNFRDEKIAKTLQIAIPVILGTSVNQINKLVDRTIASSLAIGGISSLNYASRLNLFIQDLFVTSIIIVMYPLISSYASKNKIDEIKRVLLEYINIVIIILLPVTIGTIIFNREIIELLFGRGSFDDVAVQMTSSALLFYSIGMLGFGLREVLARGFYSIQDTRTPMINAVIGMIVNVILNILLSKILGIGGLALATSISAAFTTVLLFISLRKKIGSFGIKQISITFFKTIISSSIMGGITKVSYIYLINSFPQNISLLLSIIIGAISYLLIMLFMRIKEVDSIIEVIKMKSRNIIYKNRR